MKPILTFLTVLLLGFLSAANADIIAHFRFDDALKDVTGQHDGRPADPTRRARMTASLSSDEGKTWSAHKLVHEGPSFYSDLVVLPDGTIGLLYGRGQSPHGQLPDHVAFARFNLEWLKQP